MTTINTNAQTRKFQFFDEIRDDLVENEDNEQEQDKKENEEESKPSDKLNIKISSVLIEKEGQMQVMDGVIFVCGKVIYEETKQKFNKMLKIIDNEVIDEYTLFNKYYDFHLMKFSEKPLLIVFGFWFMKFGEQLHKITSIKFYNSSHFIEKKNERYQTKEKIIDTEENYPELLQREIRLYKKGNLITCETEGNITEGLTNLENCISFSVDSSLNYCAISLVKGELLILSGFPNLLDCKSKKMKTTLLSLPEKGGSNIDITNIKMGQITSEGNEKKVLYVSTKKYLAYYEWNYDEKGADDLDNNIQCKFIQNIPGVGEGGLFVKNNNLLVASSDDKFIYEYTNCKLNKLEKDENGNIKIEEKGKKNGELLFEGNKKNIMYFNGYIVYHIISKAFSTLQVFDNINNFFVFIKSYSKKIISICSDNDYIYVFVEENESRKYIVKLVEIENKKKFDVFFSRKFYQTAADYAKFLGYDDHKLTEIYKKQAEFEYSKGEFNKSIQAYINTINYLDPSIIIQKFLTKSKMEFLIKYLEAIESNITFKQKSSEKYTNYINLLLNCYLMKEEIPKLEKFIEKKKDISPEILKTVIDVCLDTQNVDLALSIAKNKNMNEDYIQILILKQNKLKEALDFLYPEKDNEKGKKFINRDKEEEILKEKVNLFCKFGEHFLKTGLKNDFFERIKKLVGEHSDLIDEEDKKRLLEIFVSDDEYYKKVFKIMINYGLELDRDNLHRRIELYLEEDEKEEVIKILKDKKYIGLYDNEYLMLLFKHKNFSDGIETISELTNQKIELLSIYIQKREYEKIIKLCDEYGNTEKSFWGIALKFFVDKSIREDLDEEETKKINESLQIFLDLILKKKAMLAVNALDIINEKNDTIPLDILRKFIDNSVESEIEPLDIKVSSFEESNNQLKVVNNKIKEIQTQASSFKLSKCEICFMGITFPAICFRCGHCYHSTCLNINDDKELDNASCPKCEEEREKVKQQLLDLKSIFDDVNTKEKLNNQLEYAPDKFEFVHNLYGRGVINIDPAYDDFNTKDIKEALSLVEEENEKNK